MPLCGGIALALFCQYMDKHRPFHPFGLLEYPQQLADIMAVHRAQISDAHIFKQHTRDDELLQAVFRPADAVYHLFPVDRNAVQGIVNALLQLRVGRGCPQTA